MREIHRAKDTMDVFPMNADGVAANHTRYMERLLQKIPEGGVNPPDETLHGK